MIREASIRVSTKLPSTDMDIGDGTATMLSTPEFDDAAEAVELEEELEHKNDFELNSNFKDILILDAEKIL